MAIPSFLLISLFTLLTWLGAAEHGVLAQDGINNSLFSSLLDSLDNLGYTNFTAVARQVTADPQEITFSLNLVDTSSPKTLFVPNNSAFANPSINLPGRSYDPSDNTFLSALLLYHLLPGSWSQDSEALTSHANFPIPTSLNGHNVTDLQSGTHQVLVCARGADGSFAILNQVHMPTVVLTGTTSSLVIYEIDAIIGLPPSYSISTVTLALNGVEALRAVAGAPSLDNAQGYTLFAPTDAAFGFAGLSPSNITDPGQVWNNHVIMGQTVYSAGFVSQVFTSASGLSYAFDDSGTQVTLNGVTANIVRSDVLTDNGVVHIIDCILWNTTLTTNAAADLGSTSGAASVTPSPTVAAAPTVNASTSSTVSSGTASRSAEAAAAAAPAATLSPGAIVGIVALGMAALTVPLIVVITRRHYRHARPDDDDDDVDVIKVRHDRSGRRSVFEPPTPVPFRAWCDTGGGGGDGDFPLKGSPHEAPAAPPPARPSREKAAGQFALRAPPDPARCFALLDAFTVYSVS
ncbi:hypothetical protein PHLGIDRAFT_327582 [Phlebiopsis gigantea 11061_1 CR5-6]|uniref:FAS1 domain-containing protein n=1 Tax=Phlebiopsis gigantea (strain 11061_1 CR5-6) TaxID=745531 RepID=A0A0C3P2U1_PHLG1|nr:hypothetical protein PHLGIDRAFT_327582 [Phlebiopsis gigantea 11061_1 CR5-6]